MVHLIISISEPPITISYDMSVAYTFAEEANEKHARSLRGGDARYGLSPGTVADAELFPQLRDAVRYGQEPRRDFNAVSLAAEFTHGLAYALDVDTDHVRGPHSLINLRHRGLDDTSTRARNSSA